jgi:hypothetical protein
MKMMSKLRITVKDTFRLQLYNDFHRQILLGFMNEKQLQV